MRFQIPRHTYQHGRAEVKVLEELRDKEMRLDSFLGVDTLDLAQDVRHPVKVALVTGHPHKVHLQEQDVRHPVKVALVTGHPHKVHLQEQDVRHPVKVALVTGHPHKVHLQEQDVRHPVKVALVTGHPHEVHLQEQDVRHPVEVALVTSHPHKVHLGAIHKLVIIDYRHIYDPTLLPRTNTLATDSCTMPRLNQIYCLATTWAKSVELVTNGSAQVCI